METGAQYFIQDVFNDYEVQDLINGTWVSDPNHTNVFDYNQNVLGVYGTTSYEGDKWGVKIGPRLENTDLKSPMVTKNKNETKTIPTYSLAFIHPIKFKNRFHYQRVIQNASTGPVFGI